MGYLHDGVIHLSILIFDDVLAGFSTHHPSKPSGYSCELGSYGPKVTCLLGGVPGRPVGWDFGCLLGQVVIDCRHQEIFCDRLGHPVGHVHLDCSLGSGCAYGVFDRGRHDDRVALNRKNRSFGYDRQQSCRLNGCVGGHHHRDNRAACDLSRRT